MDCYLRKDGGYYYAYGKPEGGGDPHFEVCEESIQGLVGRHPEGAILKLTVGAHTDASEGAYRPFVLFRHLEAPEYGLDWLLYISAGGGSEWGWARELPVDVVEWVLRALDASDGATAVQGYLQFAVIEAPAPPPAKPIALGRGA